MDIQEAKKVLHTYRENMTDQSDTSFEGALKLAEEDPELQSWFEEEQAFDEIFSSKLKEVEPPAGLKERILTWTPEATQAPQPNIATINTQDPSWWQKSYIWSAAACFLLLITIGIQLSGNKPQPGKGPTMEQYLAAISEHSDLFNNNLVKLSHYNEGDEGLDHFKEFLAQNHAPLPNSEALPNALKGMVSVGCLNFTVYGKPVSLICFKGDKDYHLYITEFQSIPGCKNCPKPRFKKLGKNQVAATWVKDSKVFMLTTTGEEKDLKPVLL